MPCVLAPQVESQESQNVKNREKDRLYGLISRAEWLFLTLQVVSLLLKNIYIFNCLLKL